jgi:hypothetical protein
MRYHVRQPFRWQRPYQHVRVYKQGSSVAGAYWGDRPGFHHPVQYCWRASWQLELHCDGALVVTLTQRNVDKQRLPSRHEKVCCLDREECGRVLIIR